MARILNIIFAGTLGGAFRTMVATAKYSARGGGHTHALAVLSLPSTDPRAIEHAYMTGLEIPIVKTREDLHREIERADIVQINWWQHPEMDDFLRSNLPPCRLIGWFHCAGDRAPQVVTTELLDLMDMAVAGSFYTYEAPSFQGLSDEERSARTAMVNGGADFQRLENFTPRAHSGFRVTYIGTVDFIKLHPGFVRMSGAAQIPDVTFTVCGGPHHPLLKKQATDLGIAERFDLRGFVAEVADVLAESDVFGYPIVEDTYAASELTLQEAMYCGIPPVVFAHGGIKRIVQDRETGMVVKNEQEYSRALEFLYRNPAERARLGGNAARYAREHFGAERWAPKMNEVYERVLSRPKQTRAWGSGRRSLIIDKLLPHPRFSGAERMLESLGHDMGPFRTSYLSNSIDELLTCERKIMEASVLMRRSAVLPYSGYFPNDPFLKLWAGLVQIYTGDPDKAAFALKDALHGDLGPHTWRVLWYLARAAEQCSDNILASNCLAQLAALQPDFLQRNTAQ